MLRVVLIGGSIPLGLLTGLAAWLFAGGPSAALEKLAPLESAVGALRAPRETQYRPGVTHASILASTPIFALTTGPGAVREPALRVDGLSVTPRRAAALVSIDGKPAEWLSAGETRDGVTILAVTSTKVTFETLIGEKDLGLGEQTTASAPAETASGQAIIDQMPRGFRGPPPPASAPGAG